MTDKSGSKRGLVIQGGGAKGAFALGCMREFQRLGIEFSAVSGTSAGGLCSVIWSTQKIDEGVELWSDISHATFLGQVPEGCIRRLLKILCIVGKVFLLYVNGTEPEGRPQFRRDVFFSILVGILFWALTPFGMPTWLIVSSLIAIPVVAAFAFANALPFVGPNRRSRSWMVGTQIFLGEIAVITGTTSLLLGQFGFIKQVEGFSWAYVGYNAAIIAAIRAPMEFRSILLEANLFRDKLANFLSGAELKIPTYVTIAEEIGPRSSRSLLPTPGVFKTHYAPLQNGTDEERALFAYASAALPLGILPEMKIGDAIYVDGGVADNTPIIPIVPLVDEIWLISLSHVKPDLPGYPRVKNDLREHMRNVLKQEALARGLMEHEEEKHQKFFDRFDRIELDVFSPLQDLGNLITGTLNFSQERTAALIAHGEYVVRLKFSPLKQPEYKFETGIGGFWKAIPACSLRNPFKRADISNPSQGEFELPKIYVKPDEAARPSWLASVMFLWIIYKDYSITDGWRRYLWATLISLVVLSIPTWWARLRRNFDIR